MLPLSKSDDLSYKVMRLHDDLEASEGQNAKLLLGVPLSVIVLMWVFEVNYALRLSLTVLVVSLFALFYAFKVFVWLMQKSTGSLKMQEIASYIQEGSEGYFQA